MYNNWDFTQTSTCFCKPDIKRMLQSNLTRLRKNMDQQILTPVRTIKYDILRTIGLLAIILAHVNPPDLLFQIRNFDVPLMVFVSGAVYGLFPAKEKNYFVYLFRRVGRLLLPTWILLSFYFFLFPVSVENMISSYVLLDGIGYVWVIRVFILTALLMPLLFLLKRTFKKTYIFFLLGVYLFYELFIQSYPQMSFLTDQPMIDFLMANVVFYMLSYGFIAGLGLSIKDASQRTILFILSGFLTAFVYMLFQTNFASTQDFKYPPTLYYVSYAMVITLLLFFAAELKFMKRFFSNSLLKFIAVSSLWIYLWHILFLTLWDTFSGVLPSVYQHFLIEYVFVFAAAVGVTFLQKKIVTKFLTVIHSQPIKTFLTLAFLK